MDSHPKAMTVSYGTFSCTLEGFDDPFTTMQLVAEYFRKLSADDRYFGSEPLQPDASKLHQIAESANPNRIDAEVTDNSIVLRQAEIVDVPSKLEEEISVEQTTDDAAATFKSRRQTNGAISSEKTPVEDVQEDVEEAPKEIEDVQVDTQKDTHPEVADAPKKADDVESSAEKFIAEATAENTPPVKDIAASLDKNINDTTTADELAPSLEEEIPSETVSAAVQALQSDESIDRWLETANEKMATPEHVSKANALERLKAAVAATEAERANRMENIVPEVVETGEERRDNTITFRRELAKVRKAYEAETSVFSRPKSRKAVNKSNGTRPLVLDMGQRIDHSEQAEDIDVQDNTQKKSGLTLVSDQDAPAPKRHPKVDVNIEKKQPAPEPEAVEDIIPATKSSDLPSFEEFSRMMGASTLIELLEASAAYMTLVLGKDRYTEKQISANLPPHIKRIVKEDERVGTLDQLNKRGYVKSAQDGSYTISLDRKAAYQKKYLAG
ncbi:hypothetical protein [Amylibacter sp. SFDW26]|uniref:hypothetical protein n=1 Tax=Amylibacter sp. SFDW26 TaxID=2652722 RepID=UPI00186A0C4E|nr:hypothetical protein [Amylibacter sp. SFDW26]